MKTILAAVSLVVLVLGLGARAGTQGSGVTIRHDPASAQYVVEIGGKPFTTYRYGKEFPDKPVFYPVMSPNGARVNREYPMVTGVAGESSDHPHHQSLFFTYDEVNGTNFWNPEQTGRRIVHVSTRVVQNRLISQLNWDDKEKKTVLGEMKIVTFGGGGDVFWMDHDITLRAAVPVTMGDTKEGAFGIRLNDTLKENGGSGRYINAEGLETAAKVWGKTSPWVAIRGTVKDAAGEKPVTVAIFAKPTGLNFPPYWHARDYGLFSANPFARKGYDPTAPERITKMAMGDELPIRFRVAVYSAQVTKARLDQDFAAYR
jgi:hypothetical protein